LKENYIDIFDKIETALKQNSNLSERQFQEKYKFFLDLKFTKKSDSEYFDILKLIVFYSGFKAETVTKKIDTINKHFPDFGTIAKYNEKQTAIILADKKMIKNRNKISATIKNAIVFQNIVRQFGSFQNYIESFKTFESFENLMLFKEELEYKFDYLGGITVYHFLTDIGLQVIKPDRVIARIFMRLGLIESERQLLKTVILGRKFAESTQKPIRYIDIILVKFGQQGQDEVCLTVNPKCNLCYLIDKCNFYKLTENS
jgi:DNA-3-methyladenine glycosylase I